MKVWSFLSSLVLVVLLASAVARPAPTLAAAVDGFDFPLASRDGTSGQPSQYSDYDVKNPYLSNEWSRCYDKSMSELRHAGEDWKGGANAPVYAIASGTVVWSGSTDNLFGVVILEHILPDGVSPWPGNKIYSLYGHLDPNSLVARGTSVQRRDLIGRIRDRGDGAGHLHLEVRQYANLQEAPNAIDTSREKDRLNFCNTSWAGVGFTNTHADPDDFGFTDPTTWISTHRKIDSQEPEDSQDTLTIAWVAPVTSEQVYMATGGTIRLEVSVTASAGIRDVSFVRWDAINKVFVPITVDTTAPYQATVEVSSLNLGWNQVSAVATDKKGNRTSTLIWVYRSQSNQTVYVPQAFR